jgi:hypothetical protein
MTFRCFVNLLLDQAAAFDALASKGLPASALDQELSCLMAGETHREGRHGTAFATAQRRGVREAWKRV